MTFTDFCAYLAPVLTFVGGLILGRTARRHRPSYRVPQLRRDYK